MEIAIAEFVSKTSSAGDVYVELGFKPSHAIITIGVDQTNSNTVEYFDPLRFPGFGAQYLLDTGSTGVRTRVTTAGQIVEPYEGGDIIATAETTDTAGKHVSRAGVAAAAGHQTAAGILIPAEVQVAGAKNILIATRSDK